MHRTIVGWPREYDTQGTKLGISLIILDVVILLALAGGLSALYVYQRRTRRLARQLHEETLNHTWSTIALHQALLHDESPIPVGGHWAASSDLLVFLVRFILRERPQLVVELGSGLSTVVLGHAVAKVGGHLVSIEAELEYLDNARELIAAAQLGAHVSFVHAPLCVVDGQHRWYQTSELDELSDIDLLLIDGPPATTCPLARYPALPFFRHRLSSSAAVVLDDAGRDEERQVITRWKAEYPDLTVTELPLGHSPALVTFAGDNPSVARRA